VKTRRILGIYIVILSLFLLTACKQQSIFGPKMVSFSDPDLLEELRRDGVAVAAIPGEMPDFYSYEGYQWREKTGEYVLHWDAPLEHDVYELERWISLRINPGEETISVPHTSYRVENYISEETGITCYVLHEQGTIQAFWVYDGTAYYLGGNLEEEELYAILDTIVIT